MQGQHISRRTAPRTSWSNLNNPEQLKTQLKRETLDVDRLGLALVAADWLVLLATVLVVARRLAKDAIKNGWSERGFHARFA